MTMDALFAQARFLLYRHGWPLALAVVLGLLAAGLHWLVVVPMKERLAELRTEQRALLAKRAAPDPSGQTASDRIDAVKQRLAGEAATLAAIATLHEAARAHGVELARGEYRLMADGRAPWQRYQITVPARGSYPALRHWLAEVMEAVPAASLDELGLRRDDAGDAMVEARIRLTIYRSQP